MYLRVIASMIFVALMAAGCTAEEKAVKPEVTLDSAKNRISYTIGVNIGQDFKTQKMDIDPDVLLEGLNDSMAGKELRMTEMEQRATKNKEEGEAFLAENAKKEGIVVTESGLQYKIVEPGEGDSPGPNDVATVHYRGTLIDGKQFDSSYDRGQPATFPVGGVIAGWTEALQLMKPGAKWQLFIPSELAYGERGAGQDIGPNAVLTFDVELISVEKGE